MLNAAPGIKYTVTIWLGMPGFLSPYWIDDDEGGLGSERSALVFDSDAEALAALAKYDKRQDAYMAKNLPNQVREPTNYRINLVWPGERAQRFGKCPGWDGPDAECYSRNNQG